MNIFQKIHKGIIRAINNLYGKAAQILRKPRKIASPLADRLLADALRLAEIPSPTEKEEQRAGFVLERLKTLGIVPSVDEYGNIFVRVDSASPADEPPVLLFAALGSTRWHPLESLSRLDAECARGAGLADVLGAAALLSAAECMVQGLLKSRRNLNLLFAACSFDDPGNNLFNQSIENPVDRPIAAIGVRGLLLGTLMTHVQGTYRLEITMSLDRREGRGDGEISTLVMDTLLSTAGKLSGITWDPGGITRLYIRRIEAGTAFGRTPSEAVMEVDLESSDGALLDMAMNTVKATVESSAQKPGLKLAVNVTSSIPVGDEEISRGLCRMAMGIMKEQRIKVSEEKGADVSALLSNQGIPALSLGIAQGNEGRVQDSIEIDSIEKGRVLLETLILRLDKGIA